MDRNTLIVILIAALVLLAVVSEALKAFEKAERQLDEESKKKAEEARENKDSDS
jgi:uncharacterized protein YpmB